MAMPANKWSNRLLPSCYSTPEMGGTRGDAAASKERKSPIVETFWDSTLREWTANPEFQDRSLKRLGHPSWNFPVKFASRELAAGLATDVNVERGRRTSIR